jgi:hypothetical protein
LSEGPETLTSGAFQRAELMSTGPDSTKEASPKSDKHALPFASMRIVR